jgi:CDP-paratose 2-epimerase
VRVLVEAGFDVVGIENDMRGWFFGPGASTARTTAELADRFPGFRSLEIDIRDADALDGAVAAMPDLELVVHAAAQPSHDWAAGDPRTDFAVNAVGTLNLLEVTRRRAPEASFVLMSTNKVYGDTPNFLPLEESDTRLDLAPEHPYFHGVDTSMSIDSSMHSPFGVSKAAGDLLTQEYGRYFGMRTCCFRCGCITGPAHAGTELHGFLSYLMRATVTGTPYAVYGYQGKQVRDNISGADLAAACLAFHRDPKAGAVYNMGGGREASCSMLEAIRASERIAGRQLDHAYVDEPRRGDHRWWISDLRPFLADYPAWAITADVEELLRQIHDANSERWAAEPA